MNQRFDEGGLWDLDSSDTVAPVKIQPRDPEAIAARQASRVRKIEDDDVHAPSDEDAASSKPDPSGPQIWWSVATWIGR